MGYPPLGSSACLRPGCAGYPPLGSAGRPGIGYPPLARPVPAAPAGPATRQSGYRRATTSGADCPASAGGWAGRPSRRRASGRGPRRAGGRADRPGAGALAPARWPRRHPRAERRSWAGPAPAAPGPAWTPGDPWLRLPSLGPPRFPAAPPGAGGGRGGTGRQPGAGHGPARPGGQRRTLRPPFGRRAGQPVVAGPAPPRPGARRCGCGRPARPAHPRARRRADRAGHVRAPRGRLQPGAPGGFPAARLPARRPLPRRAGLGPAAAAAPPRRAGCRAGRAPTSSRRTSLQRQGHVPAVLAVGDASVPPPGGSRNACAQPSGDGTAVSGCR